MNNSASCPVCHASSAISLGRDGHFDVWRCHRCEASFVHPLPIPEVLDRAYSAPTYFAGELRGGYKNYDSQTERILPMLVSHLDRLRKPDTAQSILDYGCAFGSHLQLAVDRGWECYGVEVSDYARSIAQQRLGSRALLGKRLSDLIPHCYDVVIMLDVIEHLPRPHEVFYELFRFGCISPHTTVLVTTPNGGCSDAIGDLLSWQYFHPPYHLINYSGASLGLLFQELRFTSIEVAGIHPDSTNFSITASDTSAPGAELNTPLRNSGGLLCIGMGSDFHDFMQERYVPGTWAGISAWEHLPRYLFAKKFAAGKRILDFGCGSGYGSALLASVGVDVLGLDISDGALSWARAHHQIPSLRFAHADETSVRPCGNFDLITCFEVIEHLSEADQEKLIIRLAQFLAPDGRLLISTPNPCVTAKYGENPFHLHELGRSEFEALLRRHFIHLEVYRQDIRTATTFASERSAEHTNLENYASDSNSPEAPPACWLAICSHHQNYTPPVSFCSPDIASDPIDYYLSAENKINQLKIQANQCEKHLNEISRLHMQIGEKDILLQQLGAELQRVEAAYKAKDNALVKFSLLAQAKVGRIGVETAEKDTLLQQSGTEPSELNRTLDEGRHHSLAALAAEQHRMEKLIAERDISLQQLGNEIQRVESAYSQKCLSLQQLGNELQRVESAYSQKCETLLQQGSKYQAIALLASVRKPSPLAWAKKAWKSLTLSPPPPPRFTFNIEAPADFNQAPPNGLISGWLFEASTGAALAVRIRSGSSTLLGRNLLARPDVAQVHPRAGPVSGFEIEYAFTPGGAKRLVFEALLQDGRWQRFAIRKIVCRSLRKAPSVSSNSTVAYHVKAPSLLQNSRPKVLHALANFMVGGSSRLVIDLVEHMGGYYEQTVLTSLVPEPPAYLGIQVDELDRAAGAEAFVLLLANLKPAWLHIHYWGDIDEPWYALVYKAAEKLGIPVIQNINTPIAPYVSSAIWRNVYVSSTVLREFGGCGEQLAECVIYPGSDFSMFTRPAEEQPPDDCIGMVYRLEIDKLNAESIQPFIQCVQLRPATRVLIVGGGSLLEPFKAAVQQAGVASAFEFTGYVPYKDLPSLYRRMSLFAAPVWKESFGQVSPFAMHMRLPVVGYSVGAIPEIVDNLALVAPAGDARALGALMASLLDDRFRRLEVGSRNAARAAELFSVEGMIISYRALYAELAALRK